MKTRKTIVFYGMLVFCSMLLLACSKKADENKPAGQAKSEAEQMTAAELRSMALEYKDAILAKKDELVGITAKFKAVPITEKLGTEAEEIMAEMEALNKSVSALTAKFQIYYDKLKEMGGDISGLEL